MRMESDQAGRDVVQAARSAPYHPAVALLTAFPVDEADWEQLGAHQMLLKPMHTRILLQQIDKLFETRDRKLASTTAHRLPPSRRILQRRLLQEGSRQKSERKDACKENGPAFKGG